VRLDPYAGRHSTAALTDAELMADVISPLLDPPAERTGHGVVHMVDAARAVEADFDPWKRSFSLWNEKRNAVQTTLHGEVVVMLPRALTNAFATAAPDVWSVRSGEYDAAESVEGMVNTTLEGSSVVATAHVTAAAVASSRSPREWLTIPRLALWGGDIVVRPWLEVPRADSSELDSGAAVDDDEDRAGAHLRFLLARRRADRVLWSRRFAEAEHRYTDLFESLRLEPDVQFAASERAIIATGLSVAIGAQGRAEPARFAADRARQLAHGRDSPGDTQQLLNAVCYVHWLLGKSKISCDETVRNAELFEPKRVLRKIDVVRGQRPQSRSQMAARLSAAVQALEHGELRLPSLETAWRARPPAETYEAEAERRVMAGDVSAGRALLSVRFAASPDQVLTMEPTKLWSRMRPSAALAFLEIVEGDDERAAERLRSLEDVLSSVDAAELDRPRMEAALAHTAFVYQLSRGAREQAISSFARCEQAVARCAATAFDQRSLLRARAAARLGTLRAMGLSSPDLWSSSPVWPPEPWRSLAEELLSWVDTSELVRSDDLVLRVLAVEACRELNANVQDRDLTAARTYAKRAAELAEPLAESEIPVWQTLADATVQELALATREPA